MSLARKMRIYAKQIDADGIAHCGCGCGEPVDLEGPAVIYEHTIPFWIRPDLDDDGPNVQAWCKGCSDAKTGGKGGDLSTIAKTKRQIGLRLDVPREPPKRPIQGRKDPWPKGRKLQSRGFG